MMSKCVVAKHFVKIFYGSYMETLEQEVNEFTGKNDFGSIAKIQNIQVVQKDQHGSLAIMVHYMAYDEVK